ncbi:MAG: GAF domain-containing protein [Deltaproteobacteria bacterium]|nr:GAF domain-containing protein [Deltaproteobacteria bacterium]
MTEGRLSEPSVSGFLAAVDACDNLCGLESLVAGSAVEVRRQNALVIIAAGDASPDDVITPYADSLARGDAALLLLGHEEPKLLRHLPPGVILGRVPELSEKDVFDCTLEGLFERVELRRSDERMSTSLDRFRYEFQEVLEISKALTQERDIDRLLDLILEKSRYVTGADAGSIYVIEGEGDTRCLRFKLSQNDSCDFESSEFTMPVSTGSIAGYAVVARRPISIADVYAIPEDAPYGFDASFDRRVGYRTRSMIAVPMISAEGEVIGVIQLINKKKAPERKLSSAEAFDRLVVAFDERSADLLQSLASQAGIALENALLYDEIRAIFEGFVRASVQAIEQRDPTTSGHSLRVSVLSCGLAEVTDGAGDGDYREVRFSRRDVKELEYASLLHDFGKIGVREQVLVKAKKLYPEDLEAIRWRVHYALARVEVDALQGRMQLMERGASVAEFDAVEQSAMARRSELERALEVILDANEPTVLSEGDFSRIEQIGALPFVGRDGVERALLTSEEVHSLQVRRGSLNAAEMSEIRSHVVHTKDFLSRIPWGKSFARIPEIAGAHHEKLDGSGYPLGRKADEIPVASKIMTIADIYDALTARDRPYKRAMPRDRALDILGYEVKDGHVDAELFRIFVDSKIYLRSEEKLSY